MLISPPFLPARLAHESEDDWLDRCMSGDAPGRGAFPVSHQLGWHGGLHLTAPAGADGAVEPVRAIADGTVVALRAPTPRPPGPLPDTHPLVTATGWTDNGMVMLRHDTEIGEGPQARVTFFSLVMHLRALDPRLRPGRTVYRKAVLGEAGQIAGGLQRQIHFEIVCDDAHMARLAGRASGPLDTGTDGRRDVVFGEMYGVLKPGFKVYAQKPPAHEPLPRQLSPKPVQVGCVVGLRYAGGEGPAGHRGDLTVTTYHLDGAIAGQPLVEREAEYELYAQATALSRAYPQGAQPAPSAVYELLRFGRVINVDHETLSPADVPHWRQIQLPGGGQGWVNLNAPDVRKFSDADFPHWKGWRWVDDASDGDSRCDSALIRGWLDLDGDRAVSPAEAQARLSQPQVARRLSRTICKFPTDWDARTVDSRWGWLKTSSPENPEPLTAAEFAGFKQHIDALAFWSPAIGLPAVHWHWQPREFIRVWRRCGWMHLDELTQLLPRQHGRKGELASIPWATARQRFMPYAPQLNLTLRKYLIQGMGRQVHFLAQTYIETAMWRVMEEIGKAHPQQRRDGTLYWPAPMMQYYGPFYGRGIMQLTWAGNFAAYGEYRDFPEVGPTHAYADSRITHQSRHHPFDPKSGHPAEQWHPNYDPDVIAQDGFNACDSGGYYWASKSIGANAIGINRVADQGTSSQTVGRISVLINGGGFGYAERQAYASFIEQARGDDVATVPTKTLTATKGSLKLNVYVDFTAQRPN